MATATPPSQPSSDEAAQIVGERLQDDLVDAGLERSAARAIHGALELVVLRLMLVLATKQDLRDLADALRREFTARFEQQDSTTGAARREFRSRFDQQNGAIAAMRREFEARFNQQDGAIAAMRREFEARFSQQDRAIAELRRDLRWGFGLIITIGVALLIAVLTAMISLLSNGA